MGMSTSQAEFAFQLGANYVDYLITVQHHCVQQIDNHTVCRSEGSIEFIPRDDVYLEIDGHYDYHMTTDPMAAGAGARVDRIGTPTVYLFGDGGTALTGVGPASGTIDLSAEGLLPAGAHYRLVYISRISFLGGVPTTATGSGQIHFRVTEVPEPAALGPLALAALFASAWRRPRRL